MIIRNHKMMRREPAIRWEESLPTGSGRVGAMAYGSIHHETILLNHEELFLFSEQGETPEIPGALEEVREILMEGRYKDAETYLSDKMMEAGGQPKRPDPYQPAFDIRVDMDVKAAFGSYRGEVDFTTGEVTVAWEEGNIAYERNLFVSRENDAVVLRVRASKPGTVGAAFRLDKHIQTRFDFGSRIATGGEPEENVAVEVEAADGWLTLRGEQALNGVTFGGAARVVVKGGEVAYEEGQMKVMGADEVLLMLMLYANAPHDEYLPAIREELEALPADYDALLEAHAAIHGPIFARTRLDLRAEGREFSNEALLANAYEGDLSAALVERMYDLGRYLLMCSSGNWPANLQGVWNGDYLPAWQSDYHNDENIQMNYWQALPGGMPELTLAYFNYYENFLDDYRDNARNLFGCRGIWIPIAQTTHGGFYHGPWINWTGAAPWLAQLFYDYWLFTGDRDFLRDRAVPFLKEVALFYEDFLFEGDDGRLVFAPSLSPENVPHVENRSLCTINATMDVALAKEALGNLCEACETLGIETEGVSRWHDMLAKLPEYEINEDGAIREWLWPGLKDNYMHRHQSHIYPIFPGFEVTEENNPEIFEACRVAVEKRLVVGLNAQTGWSQAHMANIYARLGEGERALECLSLLARSSMLPNLFTTHNDWRGQGLTLHGPNPPFQIDANLGMTAAVLEMLAFSVPGLIKLLPALPSEWPDGAVEGIHCRGGVTLDIVWDRFGLEATLTAKEAQTVTVKFPAVPAVLKSDGQVSESEHGPDYREVELPAGEPVKIQVTF